MSNTPHHGRKSKPSIIETYDAIAEHFDITRYKPWPETIKFADKLEPGSMVLDMGCGNGRNLRFMVSKGMRVLGIDISTGQLELARARALREFPDLCENYDFAVGDVEHLPVMGNSMDVVLYIATLHHLASPEARLASMKEIHRCLKPGGLCLVSAWAREQEKFSEELASGKSEIGDGWEEGDMLLPWKLKDGDTVVGETYLRYYHLFSGEEFDELLKSTEFEVLDRYVASDNHYAILRK